MSAGIWVSSALTPPPSATSFPSPEADTTLALARVLALSLRCLSKPPQSTYSPQCLFRAPLPAPAPHAPRLPVGCRVHPHLAPFPTTCSRPLPCPWMSPLAPPPDLPPPGPVSAVNPPSPHHVCPPPRTLFSGARFQPPRCVWPGPLTSLGTTQVLYCFNCFMHVHLSVSTAQELVETIHSSRTPENLPMPGTVQATGRGNRYP